MALETTRVAMARQNMHGEQKRRRHVAEARPGATMHGNRCFVDATHVSSTQNHMNELETIQAALNNGNLIVKKIM